MPNTNYVILTVLVVFTIYFGWQTYNHHQFPPNDSLVVPNDITVFSNNSYNYDMPANGNLSISNYTSIKKNEKFVTITMSQIDGLGNQMFRISSLYGIAKKMNRTPYFNSDLQSVLEAYRYYSTYFPALIPSGIIKLIPASTINETKVDFVPGSRKYEDPTRLTNETAKYVKLTASYVQRYRFFDEYKPFLKKVFECNSNVVAHTRRVAEKAQWNLNSHNFCVNTRRGDFVQIPHYRHTSKYFANPATTFTLDLLQQKIRGNINVIYSSDDPEFTKGLYKGPKNGTTFVDSLDLGFNKYESLCFHIHNCNSVLLTATGTTFGWWLAYLKEKPGDIYYDGVIAHTQNDWVLDDYVPPWWRRICVESGVPKLAGNQKCQRNSAYPYNIYQS